MIQYVNILTKDGKSLLFRNYGTSEVDRDLLARILNVFTEIIKENSQSEIKIIQKDTVKYFYTIINKFIIIIVCDLEDDDFIIKSKLLGIRIKFTEKYEKIFEDENWTDNRTLFHEFEKQLDNLILGAIKISVLGFGGVGKTELIKLICGQDVNLEYVPTITADIAELGESITIWDFAGQAQFRTLWKSLLVGTDIVLLVTDSTYENISQTKDIIHDLLDKFYPDKLVVGIANYQEKPYRLSPEFCERLLSTEKRTIKVYGVDTRNPIYREKLIAILREAIQNVSNRNKQSQVNNTFKD